MLVGVNWDFKLAGSRNSSPGSERLRRLAKSLDALNRRDENDTGRSFFGFAKRRFRMKLLLGEWEKWFRTKGSVRNLYRKKSKRFRTHGFVPNPSRIMSKRFRTDGFARNPFRIMSKKGFAQMVSYKTFQGIFNSKEALPTEKSFSS